MDWGEWVPITVSVLALVVAGHAEWRATKAARASEYEWTATAIPGDDEGQWDIELRLNGDRPAEVLTVDMERLARWEREWVSGWYDLDPGDKFTLHLRSSSSPMPPDSLRISWWRPGRFAPSRRSAFVPVVIAAKTD